VIVGILAGLAAVVATVVTTAVIGCAIGRRAQVSISRFAVSINAQLATIHELVNSDMTAARQELLDQTEITLVMLRRIVADTRQAGDTPTDEDLAAVAKTAKRVKVMRGVLADRLAQQRVVEQEQRDAKAIQERMTGGNAQPP
jgi:hypothetical protein